MYDGNIFRSKCVCRSSFGKVIGLRTSADRHRFAARSLACCGLIPDAMTRELNIYVH